MPARLSKDCSKNLKPILDELLNMVGPALKQIRLEINLNDINKNTNNISDNMGGGHDFIQLTSMIAGAKMIQYLAIGLNIPLTYDINNIITALENKHESKSYIYRTSMIPVMY